MKVKNLKINSKYREVIILLIDLTIVSFSFLLTTFGRFDFNIERLIIYGFQMNFIKAFGVIVVYALSFYIFKVYKSLWKYMSIDEARNISLSVLLATTILLGYCFLFNNQAMLINIIIVAGMLSILAMFSLRVAYRMYRYSLVENADTKKAIIIGAGSAGYIILKELEQNEKKTTQVIGFVDDKKTGMIVSGKNVIGTIEQLPTLVIENKVDVLYLAIPSATFNDKKRIMAIIEELNIKVKIMKKSEVTYSANSSLTQKYPIEDISIEDLLGRGEIKLEQDELKSYIEDKTICITGAGGSIGSELCRQIIKFNPKDLIMIDVNENSLYMLEQEFNRARINGKISSKIRVVSLISSIREFDAIDDLFNTYKPSTVFHAAAHKHVPLMETRPQEAIKNNIFGTNNVIKACINNKIERFIMISTDKAVNPTSVMGATKRMTELILESNRNNGITKLAAVRFGNVLGSNGSVIPIFKEQIKNGGPVTITDKQIVRYFMTIPEAAQLVLQAGYYANDGEIFVLDMGKPVKILELAERMIKLAGYKPYEEIDIIEIGLRPGEKMFEELHLDSEVVNKTNNKMIYVNQPALVQKDRIQECLRELKHLIIEQSSSEDVKNKLMDMIVEEDV